MNLTYKRFMGLLLAIVILLAPAAKTRAADAVPSMNVDARAALLMEPTSGKLLLEQNIHEKLPPASVTKVMTMLLIYEAVADGKIKWDDMVTISQHAADMGGSQIFLEPMEQQTVRDLTKSIVVSSANDAAVAMAEFIAGSEDGFVVMMNNRAKDLGMNDTTFMNACGLDTPGHLTSAYDIALMSRELINNHPEIYDFTKIWMDTITHKTARGNTEFGLANTNKLIKSYAGATGLKTGSTSQAKYCISATAARDNLNLIAVVLGAPDPKTRFHEAMKMFDYGFANFAAAAGEAAGTQMGVVPLYKGEVETVPVVVKRQMIALIPKGKKGELTSTVSIAEPLKAPVVKGTKAGEAIYFFDGKEVGRCDLVTADEVQKANLQDMTHRLLRKWFM